MRATYSLQAPAAQTGLFFYAQVSLFLSGQVFHAEDATQIGPSDQNMRRVQAAVRLAAKMGAGLAGREILFRTVSRRRTASRAPGRLTLLRKDMKTGLAPTVDPDEIARFEALAEDWWNPDGRMKDDGAPEG